MRGDPLLVADDGIRHLRAILLRRHDGDQAALLLGDGHVTRGPRHDTVDAVLLLLAGLDVLQLRAEAGHVLLSRVDIVRGIHPIERIGIIGGLIGIVRQLVVAEPLERDVPVAIAQHARHETAAGLLRVGLPRGRPHELVLASTVAGRSDDHRRVVRPDFREAVVEPLEKRRRTVTHDRHEVSAGRRVGLTLLQPLGERGHQSLHLIDVVFAGELQVDAVLAHEALRGRLLAARGEHHAGLRVPRPMVETHFWLVGAARRLGRQGSDDIPARGCAPLSPGCSAWRP